ncbi:PAS domain-containing hybrid sensor histidine kinase/response regulator [Geomesophilobacter sediminis]|uniref:histidine kinase n=1 Tax=Geomesophilobacter sediminis TaxID=2798584 RepID=A0A8J7S8Z6_9BACT|nr:PAS domain-containing protein [Geomesophilobacter sediminis]MBJ6726696.1 PAS domain-containing protein [Geomesophilobacter sediminis]
MAQDHSQQQKIRDEIRSLRERLAAAEAALTTAPSQGAGGGDENRLLLALDAAHLGMWDWHLPSGRVTWNKEHFRMMGYEPDSFVPTYRHWTDRIHPEDRAAAEAEIQAALARGAEYHAEFRVLQPDGVERTLEALGRVEHDASGAPVRLYGVVSDITERKQMVDELRSAKENLEQRVADRTANWEQAAKEREQFYRFFQTSADIMAIADPNGAFLQTNPACTDLLGYSPEELVSRPFIAFVHPDDQQPTLDEMARQQKLGYTLKFDNRYVCKDRTIRWISWRAVYDAEENCTYATGRDISLQRQQEEALRKSERDFRLLAEAMPQIVWVTDPAGRNTYFNQQWVDYTGIPLEEGYGDGWIKPFHPEDRQRAWDAWQAATKQEGRYSLEVRLRRWDGAYKWWLVRGVPVLDEQGGILKWFGTCTDIEEVKKAEQERLALEQQMQQTQKLESLGILAGGIAHDFNNILMAIMGNASLALMKMDPDSPLASNLQQIEQASERAADLARQMLAYSGKGKFLVESVDLNALVREMLHMLKVSISRNAVLRLELSERLPWVEADSTQMRQVIMNLVLNASEALAEETGIITIRSGYRHCSHDELKDAWGERTLAEGAYVYLEVSDTGCGMDQATLARIFDPFFTTKFLGRGLGMAAVQGIVRGHKGGIKISSEPGQGSTFRLLLPVQGKVPPEYANQAASDQWHGAGTILLVDDEELVLGVGSEMLRELGFSVVTADSGKKAVEIVGSGRDISLVILDLSMPEMSGDVCFQELRKTRPDLRVMISSGYSEQEVVQRFPEGRGLAGFIQKPYKVSVLKDALRKAMES